MDLVLLLVLITAVTAAAYWLWLRHSRCPRCGHRTVARLDSRLLAPQLYCVLCRFDWVPTLTVVPRWWWRRQHPHEHVRRDRPQAPRSRSDGSFRAIRVSAWRSPASAQEGRPSQSGTPRLSSGSSTD